MLKTLTNNISENYKRLSQIANNSDIAWYYNYASTGEILNEKYPQNVNIPFYSHIILQRPVSFTPYSIPKSPDLIDLSVQTINEILYENGIYVDHFIRICLNTVLPHSPKLLTIPHKDHDFPHTNFLVYLSDSDGDTIVEGERSVYEKDKAIIFEGEHFHETPSKERRIVLVATFIQAQ